MLSIKSGNGFVAGTLVHTRGSQAPIESIHIGDLVLSQNETTREKTYKRVINTQAFESQEIMSIDILKDGERFGVVVTSNHLFWLKNVGWTATNGLDTGDELVLPDESCCEIVNVAALYPTNIDGVGWMDGVFHCYRGDGLGRTVDLRNDSVKFNYDEVPYPGKSYQELTSFLTRKVFKIEIEDFHNFYMGQRGIFVHD